MCKQNKVINPMRYEADSESTLCVRSYTYMFFSGNDAQSFYRRYGVYNHRFQIGIRICLRKRKTPITVSM